jgi:hypothetical protein
LKSRSREKLAINETAKTIEKERADLSNSVKIKETYKELLKKSLIEHHLADLKEKDPIIKHKEIALINDMKLKLSRKMKDETLEKH